MGQKPWNGRRAAVVRGCIAGVTGALLLMGDCAAYGSAKWTSKPPISVSDREIVRARLHAFFDEYWQWRMQEYPEEASCLGYPGKHGEWSDLSLEAIERRAATVKSMLATLASIPLQHLDEEDVISYKILQMTLEQEHQELQFGSHYLIVDQMSGIHLMASLTLSTMPTKTSDDYAHILSRLQKLPVLLEQAIMLLEKGIEEGITPPQIAIRYVPNQLLRLMGNDPWECPLLHAFTQFPTAIEEEQQASFRKAAYNTYRYSLQPALRRFHAYLQERYLPNCRSTIGFSALPRGRQWYAHRVHASTTTAQSPAEIHAIGLMEVERIHREMKAVIASSDFKGSFEDFLHFLKTDPQFFHASREELLGAYTALTQWIESQLPAFFAKLPVLPFKVVPVPSYAAKSQAAAYYLPGSLSDGRPGYFFIDASDLKGRPKWEMAVLALHEAVPGHHLQISLAQELSHLPEFRKHAFFTAYIEGWGLYAEGLGSALGLYQDPYSLFGRLTYEMMRALRLVVDTGMHAMGWSREQALGFFKRYVSMGETEIGTEIDRYLVLPGQALAYKIGELKLLEMRRLAEEALGEAFDVRVFHSAWLKHGTLPLEVAEENIRQWIRETRETVEEKSI